MTGARRPPSRVWPRWARRAGLTLGLWLAAPGVGLAQEIVAAQYAQPTTRYAHGVLGDAVEWGALRLDLADGRRRTFTLPDTLVFEDTAPRLADLDGDAAPEVIVVESSLTKGARLAIYSAQGRITATPHIGQRNRWLAPLGAADLDGDGHVEIAYIDRPHLAKTLRIWRFRDWQLTEIAQRSGLTNHRIGWDFIAGGIRRCGDIPEIVTADATWTRIIASRLTAQGLESRDLGRYNSSVSLTAALTCR
ncbi:FG-GAP repeat domain-containing protein [Roseovarius aestuariivivens]|uniref:FG-GAP repeat domain-containing protein n=1 Tax=Roseovarius aestuariivivens TaxID=1888910 RepID=UPI001081223D|nr:VCBS repeat-containing protein [Roseovarius aestuariivivens]